MDGQNLEWILMDFAMTVTSCSFFDGIKKIKITIVNALFDPLVIEGR